MKNILTIDFDIIMKPSIQLYNDYATDNWIELLQMPEARLFRADMNIYHKLTNYVLLLLDQMNFEDVYFIEDHSQMIKYLQNEYNISLINIDHHHDCGYESDQLNHFISLENINCGNWCKRLLDNNQLTSYVWIKNTNSDITQSSVNQINNIFDFNSIDLTLLPFPDKLILCLSEPWVPPHYRPLFKIWHDYFEKKHNQHKPILRGIYKFEIE